MTEFMPEDGVIIAETAKESAGSTLQNNKAIVAAPKPPTDLSKKKKKRGIFGIFKAALFLLRHRRPVEKWAKKTVTRETTTESSSSAHWKKLVGSMRPLRLPEAALSPPPALKDIEEMIPPPQEEPQPAPPVIESIEEIKPASPEVCPSGCMSQYASATSLRDLDVSDDEEEEEEEEDPDEVFDAITGDEMIDAKAEEFIAQFYRQIHMQNTKTSATHHHHHRHTRI